jgi:hypothetical protein
MAIQMSQEEVRRLTDQKLDAFVRVVLDDSRSRRALLDRAKNYRGRQIIPVAIMFSAAGASYLFLKLGWESIIVFIVAMTLMQWHTAGVNRRIDALIELLELDSITNRPKDCACDTTDFRDRNQQA